MKVLIKFTFNLGIVLRVLAVEVTLGCGLVVVGRLDHGADMIIAFDRIISQNLGIFIKLKG